MSKLLNMSPAAFGEPPCDLAAVVSRLYIYPVKSCAGVQVEQAVLTKTGLEFDRSWMVVDGGGNFLTQRELPRMALVRPQLGPSGLVLNARGMPALHLAPDEVHAPCRVRVWSDEVQALDMGPVAARWFSDFLGVTARMVRFDPGQKRVCDLRWTGGIEALNQFSDGYPALVISEASLAHFNEKLVARGHAAVEMARFRPSIVLGNPADGLELAPHDEDSLEVIQIATAQGVVRLKPVKPCPRCPIPNIEPTTAVSSPEVSDLLQSYRQDPRVNGAATFGMNVIVLQGIGHLLKVGQSVGANYLFE